MLSGDLPAFAAVLAGQRLRLDGCIVIADALHCRPDTAQGSLATGAGHALAIMGNRPKLLARTKARLEQWLLQ
jgi:predicted transposase YbfD/YdcC